MTSPEERRIDEAEVRALFERLPEDRSARDEIVVRFRSFAEYFARRFAGRGEPVEDLAQVANIGLLNAIDRFDPEREVSFSTYAAATIAGELKRHLRDKGWAIRVPRPLQELGLRMNRVIPRLSQELGRSPTIQEIATEVDATPEDVLEAMDAAQAYSPSSLDAPIGEEGRTALETIGGDDPSLDLIDRWSAIAPSIKDLPDRERRVLYLRFFSGLTQSQIAEEIGVSQMHVSRILAQTLERLRAAAGDAVETAEGTRGEHADA
ncbi:MAG: SigB/SigF/SigG family RNA polymerase sigma factor [Solirubrobacterales bacterium]